MTVIIGTLDCNGSQSGPDACIAGGGQCVPGNVSDCATRGTQDCNPDHNPAGAICCLAFVHVGDATTNAADASVPDGTPSDANAPDAVDANESGATFECGDASCLAGSQFCYHVSAGGPAPVDNTFCRAVPPQTGDCVDAGGNHCICTEDGGGLYVFCAVP